jgi:hypothetical protein
MIQRGKKSFTKTPIKEVRVKFRSNAKTPSPIDTKPTASNDSPKPPVGYEALPQKEQNQFLEQCYKDYWTL